MRKNSSPISNLPAPAQIRLRLSDLACEANFLRALLRLLEKNRSGQRLLRPRADEAMKGDSGGG